MFFSIHNCISLYHNCVTLYINISNLARPEVRGTAEFHGGAYPHVIRPHIRTHVYHPYFAADRQAETDVVTLRDADAFAHRSLKPRE